MLTQSKLQLVRAPALPGEVFAFTYPTDNRIGVSTRLRRRLLAVESIRDCHFDCVEEWAIQFRPDLRRGRWLITGYDLESHRLRSFYWSSARRICRQDVRLLRLGLYDPLDESGDVHWTGPIWTDSRADRTQLAQVLEHWRVSTTMDDPAIALGIFEYSQGGQHAGRARTSA